MNKRFFLFILASAAVILASTFVLKFNNNFSFRTVQVSEKSPDVQLITQSALLVINYGEDSPSTYSLEVNQESTAFSLLENITNKEKISLETKKYDFGIFVESINGKKSSSQMAWIYFVNGQSGTVAADQYKVSPGDTIEWKYTKPQ